MSPEEKIEAAQKLIDEARAEIAVKKRNWPEKIEPGMCFGLRGFVYIYTDFGDLVIVRSSEGAQNEGKRYAPAKGFAGLEDDFTYLGHARDLIKIADDVPEPTGADLVGKVTEYELGPDDVIEASDDICCHGFSERRSHNWRDSFPHGITVKDAREQCKGMIRFFRKVAR